MFYAKKQVVENFGRKRHQVRSLYAVIDMAAF